MMNSVIMATSDSVEKWAKGHGRYWEWINHGIYHVY